MRVESSVTSISWIPSEAIKGLPKLPMEVVGHYDEPLPDTIVDLEELKARDAFRFANQLRAWIDVEDGRVVAHGQDGGGHIGSTSLKLGPRRIVVPAVALPDLRPEPVAGPMSVQFFQTAGGRTGVPAPRRVTRRPFVQFQAPLAWTTLSLTLSTDGTSEPEILGASSFPRHWVYDHGGKLILKSGLIDFDNWWRQAFGRHSPWGDEDSPALVTEVETALERELSRVVMKSGKKPEIRRVKKGRVLVEQGERGDELFLLLDGVLSVEVDGAPLAELGPGAILGERALIEGGLRTATLRALTPCKVAAARWPDVDGAVLVDLSKGHRREEQRQ